MPEPGADHINVVGARRSSSFGGLSEASAHATLELADPRVPRDLTLRHNPSRPAA